MLMSLYDPVLNYAGLKVIYRNIIREEDYNPLDSYLNIFETDLEILNKYPRVEI